MGERMTSPSEAGEMKVGILECVSELEKCGFDRSQIASAMAGISMGIIAAHSGLREAELVMARVSDAIRSKDRLQ